jgi:hypothetical protein
MKQFVNQEEGIHPEPDPAGWQPHLRIRISTLMGNKYNLYYPVIFC